MAWYGLPVLVSAAVNPLRRCVIAGLNQPDAEVEQIGRDHHGDLSSTPQAIHAVQLVTAMQKSDAGTREARALLKSGATTVNGATRQLSTSWQQFEDLQETDPDTGPTWTEAGVNALQGGAEVVT